MRPLLLLTCLLPLAGCMTQRAAPPAPPAPPAPQAAVQERPDPSIVPLTLEQDREIGRAH